MQIRKKQKRFWTLSRHHAEGFTLVELIVVIAILAILGGVAVPAYGGYVKKANKQADISLISEVKQALELYYYQNSNTLEAGAAGYVILDQEGALAQFDEVGNSAMTAVFGENWKETVGLMYEDWKGENSTLSYKESSYYGQESSLINTVDNLTSALGKVIASDTDQNAANNLIGANFSDFLDNNNVDRTSGKAIGNAAVLYVAQNTQGKQSEIENAFTAGLGATADSNTAVVNNLYNELNKAGMTDSAALAVIYAYAEGYAQHTGQAENFHENTNFDSVTDVNSALIALGSSFDSLETTGFNDYVTNQGGKDLKAYIDMMGTVHNNAGTISGNLNSDDCFTDGAVENMLKGHAAMSSLGITTSDGQVAVVLVVNGDGSIITHVTPINWNS